MAGDAVPADAVPADAVPGEFSTLLVDRGPDRLHVRLNRPEVRNAIDQAMIDELHLVCAELEREPRILIISGAGGIFASGADIAQLRERRAADALQGINSGLFGRIARLPMPVIAALDGWALGGGAELAYAADFRIASTTVRLGNPETALGIIPAAGALWRLAELVGEPVAKEIILAGRILNADEALAVHLVTEVHEPGALLAAAHALADRIAKQDPLATRIAKQVFHAPADAHPQADNEAQAVLFESEAKFARMTAFLERKKR
ncbi:enoyl-CoA hydratase/isomerase family protein [Cryobacterium sp. TMT1-2-1]|uniref:enoyl-CoA hydratase/isomerase family protein n=1 Tax=Cryobacterium sp. TMT1-2-1 TaxID=1259232 RepID=UPI00106BC39B|nr:enoyl-CoA hydratase/isomerase family protein [Cryobacterium sp. TMT1-2-1]TFD44397.1 enoyl-CoA hydratase/isomerase family protein [Cryobacterium sp. TMT1-2-1]